MITDEQAALERRDAAARGVAEGAAVERARRPNGVVWTVVGAVAAVAILSIAWMATRTNDQNKITEAQAAQLQATTDQSNAAAQAAAQQAALAAQSASQNAAVAAQTNAVNGAAATDAAIARAENAADRAARHADRAAEAAASQPPAPQPTPQ